MVRTVLSTVVLTGLTFFFPKKGALVPMNFTGRCVSVIVELVKQGLGGALLAPYQQPLPLQ